LEWPNIDDLHFPFLQKSCSSTRACCVELAPSSDRVRVMLLITLGELDGCGSRIWMAPLARGQDANFEEGYCYRSEDICAYGHGDDP